MLQNHKRPQLAKALEKKRTKLRISHSLTFDYTTKLLSSKQHSIGTKHRCIDQWNKIENPEINPPMYVQSVNLKQRRQIYTMGNKISSIIGAVKTRQQHVKE